jgi:hypothetical protein
MSNLIAMKYMFMASAAFLVVGSIACKHPIPATGIDKELLLLAKEPSGFTWYKNTPSYLAKSAGSGHNFSYLRTRFNTIAATMLDSNGMVKSDSVFPEGSLIVKELSHDGSSVGRFAILLKRTGHGAADEKGWIWGYVNSNETVADAASNKGYGCIGCHNQQGNIDYVLMNKYFP